MSKTALLIIDMQIGMFGPRQIPAIHESESLLLNTKAILAAARKTGLTIIYIQHCARPGQIVIRGTEAWAIHPDLSPMSDDTVIQKEESSAFENTNLYEVLKMQEVDSLIACGLQSEYCVTNTCIAGLELGFSVSVAKDCHSTVSSAKLSASQIIDQQNKFLVSKGVPVLSIAQLAKEWRAY